MDGLTDYIAWLGEFDFDTKPLNEVDALIMCVISYFELSPAMDPDGAPFYLKDCLRGELSGKLELRITGGDCGNSAIFMAAAGSRRFGELVISRYVDQIDEEQDLQFSAVVLSWKDEFSFIAYRGTDNTLVGWKEDFMIAYTQTRAQKIALAYAKDAMNVKESRSAARIGKKKQPRRWYIGGHSKGANLAMYAACMLPDSKLSKVERVFVLDGPGFAPEVIDNALLERINAKTTRIIPEYSVIGRLMEPQLTDTRIVKSSFDGFMQHSLASWGVYHGGLALSELTEPKDRWINETMRTWIEKMSTEERRTFVNELFDALMSGGAVTVDDIMKGGLEGLEAVLKGFQGFSDTTRNVLSELKIAAMAEIKGAALDAAKDAAGTAVDAALGGAKKVLTGAKEATMDVADSAKKVLSSAKEVTLDAADVAIDGAKKVLSGAKDAAIDGAIKVLDGILKKDGGSE